VFERANIFHALDQTTSASDLRGFRFVKLIVFMAQRYLHMSYVNNNAFFLSLNNVIFNNLDL
jgi:hypothetical protein